MLKNPLRVRVGDFQRWNLNHPLRFTGKRQLEDLLFAYLKYRRTAARFPVPEPLCVEIDALLQRILDGEDARKVFKLNRSSPGKKAKPGRDWCAMHEVDRIARVLIARGDPMRTARATAADKVATAYAVERKQVERWSRELREWLDPPTYLGMIEFVEEEERS